MRILHGRSEKGQLVTATYDTLLSPLRVGEATLRNRIVKTAAGSRYWSRDGYVTDRVKALFDRTSLGGVAMVCVDTLAFMPWTDARFTMGGVWDDAFVPGLRELADLVHANGALIVGQLHHAGPADFTDPVGPSALTDEEMPLNDPAPRALSLEEIEDMKEHYFAAVRRLVAADFDGVEVHAAHSYFMASFLTRVWNRRTDRYGIDTFENRTRLPREIMRGVRANSPGRFLMGVRFNGIEFGNERAMTIEESCEIAKLFEAEGADYLSVTGEGFGKMPSPMLYLPVDYFPYPEPDDFMKPHIKDFEGLGTLVPAAEAVKRTVGVPVLCVGRLDEDKAERILSQGKADLAGFNRALWADPDMPQKLMEGRPEDIRHCTRCGTCEGGGKIATMGPRVCRVNPALGRYDLDVQPAVVKKSVLVVGGGPAGMEAACTAAACGHEVTLCEKEGRLGGHLPLASMIKGTYLDNVDSILEYLVRRVETLPITVKTGTEATAESIRAAAPDAVVIACGGRYEVPDVEGGTGKNCTDVNRLQAMAKLPLRLLGGRLVNAATKRFLPGVGKRVVVVGAGMAGLQGALWLKKRKRTVTIVLSDDVVADQMPPRYRNRLLPWLDEHGVEIIANTSGIRLSGAKAVLEAGGSARAVDCDTAISLPGMSAALELYDAVRAEGMEAYVAGSAKGGGNDLIVDAIRDGREVGLALSRCGEQGGQP